MDLKSEGVGSAFDPQVITVSAELVEEVFITRVMAACGHLDWIDGCRQHGVHAEKSDATFFSTAF
ncbi:hypothetical protein JCM12296A_45220 [Desulfosarcina cetonica]